MGAEEPSDTGDTKIRSGGPSPLRIILIGGLFLTATALLVGSGAFTTLVYSAVFSQGVEASGILYLISAATVIFTILSQIVCHVYHRRPMFPLYLLSSLCIALLVYGFFTSLIVGAVLLCATLLAEGELPMPLLISLRIILTAGTLGPILYGIVDARVLRVRRIALAIEGMRTRRVRIGFVSDLHLGLLVGKRRLQRVLHELGRARPDIIIVGGDLYDTRPRFIRHLTPLLAEMSRLAPTAAVAGNHEFINGIEECTSHMEEVGMTVLRNRSMAVEKHGLRIMGVDDTSGQSMYGTGETELDELLGSVEPEETGILVSHAPLHFGKAVEYGIILELSGHTHGGQFWPFGLVTRRIYRDGDRGLHRRGDSYLYVSMGAGTWGPPIRVGAPPEMAIITLVGKG